jgi:serine/threonine protein kinase
VPPVPIAAALRIIVLVLDALHFAHALLGEDGLPLHLVHRDVSPTNIMVTPKGEVKLLDFGIARSTERISATAAGFTRGKVGFMSPEQAQGREVDARTDVFAAGLNLYWLLCGQSPFPERETDFEALRDAAQGNLTPPQVLWPEVPWPVAGVISTALALQPSARFPTALAMRQALMAYAAQERLSLGAPALAKVVEEVWRKQNLVFIPPAIAPVKPGSRT